MINNFIATAGKIGNFKSCPWKFWLCDGSKHISGKPVIPFSENQWTKKGNEIHEHMKFAGLELKKNRSMPVLTSKLWQPWWGEFLKKCTVKYPDFLIEEKIGIANDWTGWVLGDYYKIMAKTAFYKEPREMIVRSAFDAAFFDSSPYVKPEFALIVDWKSGRPRKSEVFGQLELYAMMAFCHWPTLQNIECLYVFLEHKKFERKEFTRSDDFRDLQEWFADDYKKITETFNRLSEVEPKTAFYATPGDCHWCPAEPQHCRHSRK